jgi:polysaccharide biosynthesis transport protein
MNSLPEQAGVGQFYLAPHSEITRHADSGSSLIDIEELIAATRRQLMIILCFTALGATLGVAYLMTAVPQYTATVDVLIDFPKNQDRSSPSFVDGPLDTAAVDSQVEVIKSDNVAFSVVKALALDTDPEFSGAGTSFLSAIFNYIRSFVDIRSWFTSRAIADLERRQKTQETAARKLKGHLQVRRLERTYVISISFTSRNPGKAQAVANGFADAYFRDQLDSRYIVAKRAAGWLNDRIAELKENALKSDLAVQKFKEENGILSTGAIVSHGLQSSETTNLIADQQLNEITSQLSQAHSETGRMEARLQQIGEIIKSGRTDAAVAESLGNVVINELRSKYLRAAKLTAEFSAKVGVNHYQVVNLRNEMSEYERLIFQELQRIAATYASDLEVARAREKNLNESMASLVTQKSASNRTMVPLRELERESEVFKGLYETFLQRYQDSIQKQSFPSSEARVITAAVLPKSPSSPNTSNILTFFTFLGLLLGGGIGAYRESKDRVFRVPRQVRDELDLEVLGMLPAIAVKAGAPEVGTDLETVRLSSPLHRYVIDAPLSGFAEALRSAKIEVDLTSDTVKTSKIIGVSSTLPGEGKSAVAINFASLLSLVGSKVLLVDGDLRNPGLTRAIAKHAKHGIIEALNGEQSFQSLLLTEAETGVAFLPAVVKKRLLISSELMSSPRMAEFLSMAREKFDYILVDLPPMTPVVDVRATERFLDASLLVIEWGKTPRSIVKSALVEHAGFYQKCIGTVFNKVQRHKFSLYREYGEKTYYYDLYGTYYKDQSDTK